MKIFILLESRQDQGEDVGEYGDDDWETIRYDHVDDRFIVSYILFQCTFTMEV